MSDVTKSVIDFFVNLFPEQNRKELHSILTATVKNAEYFRQHPEEKPSIIKKANELFQDWKESKKETDDYHDWRQGRELSLDELNRNSELFEIYKKKSEELLFFCMNHAMEETQDIIRQIQQIMSKTKGANSV